MHSVEERYRVHLAVCLQRLTWYGTRGSKENRARAGALGPLSPKQHIDDDDDDDDDFLHLCIAFDTASVSILIVPVTVV